MASITRASDLVEKVIGMIKGLGCCGSGVGEGRYGVRTVIRVDINHRGEYKWDCYGSVDVDTLVDCILKRLRKGLRKAFGVDFDVIYFSTYGDDKVRIVSAEAEVKNKRTRVLLIDKLTIHVVLLNGLEWRRVESRLTRRLYGEPVVIYGDYVLVDIAGLGDKLGDAMDYLIHAIRVKYGLLTKFAILTGVEFLSGWAVKARFYIVGGGYVEVNYDIFSDFVRWKLGLFFEDVVLDGHVISRLFPGVKYVLRSAYELRKFLQENPHLINEKGRDALKLLSNRPSFDAIIVNKDGSVIVVEVKFTRSGVVHYSNSERQVLSRVDRMGVPVITLVMKPVGDWLVMVKCVNMSRQVISCTTLSGEGASQG